MLLAELNEGLHVFTINHSHFITRVVDLAFEIRCRLCESIDNVSVALPLLVYHRELCLLPLVGESFVDCDL